MKEHSPERQGGNDPQRSSSSTALLLPSWNETSPLAISHRGYGVENNHNKCTSIQNHNDANFPKEFSMLHPEKRSWSMIYHPPDSPKFSMLHAEKRSWSMIHGEYSALRSPDFASWAMDHPDHDPPPHGKGGATPPPPPPFHHKQSGWAQKLAYSTVFAFVNVIIGLPCLYGYATVIFQHPVFVPYWSAISKLIICSSLIFQLTFTCGSALPFVIGAVQDSGLVYLSHMATTIAVLILQEDATNDAKEEDDDNYGADDDEVGITTSSATAAVVLSTALVLLSLGTVVVGGIMILLGHFRLAEYIKLLPMPVVGGYLGFIGFYCFQAGVSLAISHNLATIFDWVYLVQKPDALLLAMPALVTGLVFVALSRYTSSDAALPCGMIAILALFYIVLGISGTSLEDAREANWVGDVAPPVPVTELFSLVDFSLVRWDLVKSILPMWVGLAFVVSFGSCLDITAIFVDMGESTLDINRELSTIGLGNVLSGLCLGYTGSYIFSQSIFTYRTGFHSRWTGAIVVLVFSYVVASPVNILQVTPLFFLGSTLIFIGYDLMLEWLYDVRSKCRPTEYAIVWMTFFIMPIAGVNAGIGIGAILSVVEHKLNSRRTSER